MGSLAIEVYDLCVRASHRQGLTPQDCAKLQDRLAVLETYSSLIKPSLNPYASISTTTTTTATSANAPPSEGHRVPSSTSSSGNLCYPPNSMTSSSVMMAADVVSPPWSPASSSPQLVDVRHYSHASIPSFTASSLSSCSSPAYPPYTATHTPRSYSRSRSCVSPTGGETSMAHQRQQPPPTVHAHCVPTASYPSSSSPPSSTPTSPTDGTVSSTSTTSSSSSTSTTSTPTSTPALHKKPFKRKRRVTDDRTCSECNRTRTSQWRSGPDSAVLCNACGMRFFRKQRKIEREEGAYAGSTDVMSSPGATELQLRKRAELTNGHRSSPPSSRSAPVSPDAHNTEEEEEEEEEGGMISYSRHRHRHRHQEEELNKRSTIYRLLN